MPEIYVQVDDFLQALVNFDKEHILEATVRCVRDDYLSDPEFNPDFVRQKSSAAAGLCAWVINIIRFHEVNMHSECHIKTLVMFVSLQFDDFLYFFPLTFMLLWIDFCK